MHLRNVLPAVLYPTSIFFDLITKFKKSRRLLQRKRHIKIELCVWLSILRLSHVGRVARNRRSALFPAWYKWFSCKGKEWKIYCCVLALSSEPKIWNFHVVTCQNIAPKSVPHVQHDYLSSFNQSNHWFVTSLPLPSSFLKLRSYYEVKATTTATTTSYICIFNNEKQKMCPCSFGQLGIIEKWFQKR